MNILASPRLNYFRMNEGHFAEFCQMDMDDEVMKYYTSRPHGTVEQARTSFNRYMDYMEKFPILGAYMAYHKETNEFIGLGVLIHVELNPSNTSYELGYRLPVNSWGKGYATEMARALADFGFHHLGVNELFGTTNPENTVSEKVLMKIGMKHIGTSPSYGGSNLFKLDKKS